MPVMHSRLLTILLFASATACDGQSGELSGEVTRTARAEPAVALGLHSSDSAVRRAAEAVAAGSPWIGTTRIAPALADEARRTPEARLVAARAAAGWEGWSEVERQIGGQPWLDTLAAGEGRVLLARAALAGGKPGDAARHAAAALSARVTPDERGRRLLLLARALDRESSLDSAAASYRRAADALPLAADWLRLRAAGVTRDDGERERLLDGIRDSLARTRVAITEAQALERIGRRDEAARAFAAVGDRIASLRLRLAAASDDAARAAPKGELLALVRAGGADARRAIELLDASDITLSPAEELVVARTSMRTGNVARAVRGYTRGAALRTPRDQYDFGIALGRLGRWSESRTQLALVKDPALVGDAAYHRARARYHMGDAAGARQELAAVARDHANDADAASLALWLLADLQGDDGRDADSRATLLDLVRRYPRTGRAAPAAFNAAIIAIAGGSHARAAAELDALVTRWPNAADATAARYWSGRAHADAGNAGRARERWREVVQRDPLSYYAVLARRRLSLPPWQPGAATGAAARDDVETAGERVQLLDELELDTEARFEVDALVRGATASPERIRATAKQLRDLGRTTASIDLGWRLVNGGARDADAYRLVFPVVHRERLAAESRARKLDPTLVAALIRQESNFNPRARSPVGARGLMQIMPDVGRALARSQRVPVWDPAMLYDPDASLTLGTAHLATFLAQYADAESGSGKALARALAAYNAGPSRVRRWSTKKGVADPELFAERIPFTETRDYVRIVQRNAEVYGALYDW